MFILGSGAAMVEKANLKSLALAHGVGIPEINAPSFSAVSYTHLTLPTNSRV